MKKTGYIGTLIIIAAALLLASCGSSNNSSSSGPTISGIVVDDPLVDAFVTVYGPEGEILGEGLTDSTGAYRIAIIEADKYHVVADGGTLAGAPFHGMMENLCSEAQECDVTPLTTVAVDLVDRYGLSYRQARRQAARSLGLPMDSPDPFVLAVRGIKDESGRIEGLDEGRLHYLRSQIADRETFDNWRTETIATVPAPLEDPIGGVASAAHPLAEATVSIIVDEGEPFTAMTDATGAWLSPAGMKITDPFRVEVTGGATFAADFDGTLSAYIPYRAIGSDEETSRALLDAIEVNVISTIVDRYMRHSGLGYSSAVNAVKRFLSIPAEVALDDPESLFMYFNPLELLSKSAEHLGFDHYVDSLVLDVDSGQTVTIGGAANTFTGYEIIKVGVGTKIFNGIVGGLASGGLSFALDTGMTYLLPALGYETAQQKLQSSLDSINGRLDTLVAGYSEINRKVDTLLQTLDIAQSAIIKADKESWVNDQMNVIVNQFGNMLDLVPDHYDGSSAGQISIDPALKGAADGFFADLRGEHDIDQKLFNLNSYMFTPEVGTSAFENLTQELEKKIRYANREDKDDLLWDAYLTLQNYFTKLMAIQVQGTILMTNKLNWDSLAAQESQQVQTRLYTGTADSFIEKKIAPRLRLQTDLFMASVERLVVASADTRSIVRGGGPMFPSNADDVFYCADLVAQQFHPDHKAAFVLRVIGDPTIFDQFAAGPEGGKIFGTPEYISILGQDAREYAAPIPDGYPDYYLGWYLDRNQRWHFENQATIKVAKIRFPKMEGYLDPAVRSDFPFTRTYKFPYERKDVVAFRTINLMTGEEKADGLPYAASFVTARVIPRFMHGFTDTEKDQAGEFKTFESTYSPQEAMTQSYFSVGSARGHVSVIPQIHFELYNDNAAEAQIKLKAKAEASIINEGAGLADFTYLQEENNWEVWVNAEKLFINDRKEILDKHSINYNKTTSWPGPEASADPAESRLFTIKPGNKRQIFLKSRRHGMLWKNYDLKYVQGNRSGTYINIDYPPEKLTAEFKTQLTYFELVPQ